MVRNLAITLLNFFSFIFGITASELISIWPVLESLKVLLGVQSNFVCPRTTLGLVLNRTLFLTIIPFQGALAHFVLKKKPNSKASILQVRYSPILLFHYSFFSFFFLFLFDQVKEEFDSNKSKVQIGSRPQKKCTNRLYNIFRFFPFCFLPEPLFLWLFIYVLRCHFSKIFLTQFFE